MDKLLTGQQLIDRMVAFVKRYVYLSDAQALTVVLWALNTWVYDRFYAVPYLEVWALHKRSGKSTLAEVLAAFSRGGIVLSTVRTLSMVKIIESKQGHYTPFMEEAERFWKGTLGDERGILASGYRKGGVHEITDTKGNALRFRTYAPKCFVLIGNVHDILRDRCISIKLERGAPPRQWTPERFNAEQEAEEMIGQWRDTSKHLDVVKDPDSGIHFKMIDPVWLQNDRDREIWTPIFSLAHALRLSPETMGLLKRASVDLSFLKTLPAIKYSPAQEETVYDDVSSAQAVLRDALTVQKAGEKNVSTDELLTRLYALDVGPWRTWRGEGLNALSLSSLLDRFGVNSGTVQIGTGRKGRSTPKGYKWADLQKAAKDLEGKK